MKLFKYLFFLIISIFSFAKDDYFIITQILEKGKPITKDSKCYILRKETETFMANQYAVFGEVTDFKENQGKSNDLQFRYRLSPDDVIQIANPNVEIVLKRGSQVVKIQMEKKKKTYWKVPALGKPLEKIDDETKVLYSSNGKDGKIEKVPFGLTEKKVSLSAKGTTYEVYDGKEEAVIKLLDGEIEIVDESGNIKKINPGEFIKWNIVDGKWEVGKLTNEEITSLKTERAYSEESSETVYSIPDNLSVEEYTQKGQEAEKYETAGLAELYYRKALEKLEKEKPDRSKWTEDEYFIVFYLSRVLNKVGSTKESKAFLEEYFQNVSKNMNRLLHVINNELGNVYNELGERQKALYCYLKSLELGEDLYEKDKGNIMKIRDLSVSYLNLGNFFSKVGEIQKASIYYKKLLELAESIDKVDKENKMKNNILLVSYNNLGDIYSLSGETNTALFYYLEGLKIAESLYILDNENSEARRNLWVNFFNLGNLFNLIGENQKALSYYLKGLDLSESLYLRDKENAEVINDLVNIYTQIGGIYFLNYEYEKALLYYIKELEFMEELSIKYNQNTEITEQIIFVSRIIGDIYTSMNKNEKAIAFFIKGINLSEKLYYKDKGNISNNNDLIHLGFQLVDYFFKAKDYKQASLYLLKVIEIVEESKIELEKLPYLNYSLFGIYYLEFDYGEASKYLKKYIELKNSQNKNNENNVEFYLNIRKDMYTLSSLYKKIKDRDNERLVYEGILQISERIYKMNPNYENSKKLCDIYYQLCFFHLDTKNYQEAEIYIRKRTELREKILMDDPNNKTKQKELGSSQNTLAWVLILQKKFVEARENLLKANALYPDNYASLVNTGHTYLFTGDEEKAKEYYEATIKLIETEDDLMNNGPISDFDLFIENGWEVEKCKKWKQWFLDQWKIKKESK